MFTFNTQLKRIQQMLFDKPELCLCSDKMRQVVHLSAGVKILLLQVLPRPCMKEPAVFSSVTQFADLLFNFCPSRTRMLYTVHCLFFDHIGQQVVASLFHSNNIVMFGCQEFGLKIPHISRDSTG